MDLTPEEVGELVDAADEDALVDSLNLRLLLSEPRRRILAEALFALERAEAD